MSTMSGGGSSTEFEKLIQLAAFIQTPAALDRVKELRDLEASSKEALEKANAVIAQAAAAKAALDKREAAIKQKEDALERDRAAHNRRVAGLSKALSDHR
jgi:multidrug resistance efflux pump